jgi:hypothetical protein
MMYQWLGNALPFLPRPVVVAVATAWYALMIALAVIGLFEPQAEFQYLAM